MPRVAIYTPEERRLRRILNNVQWRKNNKEKVMLYNQKPERKLKELKRLNTLYSAIKEYNRIKHLADLFL